MSPTTWSKLRRTKDANKRPIVNTDPTAAESNSLYGVSVLTTTSCPVGTALVASFQQGAVAFVRRGITLDVSNQQGTNFVNNLTSLRAEERITIGCPRPAALLKVINL
jgi:HK97 family phage major capsid protein